MKNKKKSRDASSSPPPPPLPMHPPPTSTRLPLSTSILHSHRDPSPDSLLRLQETTTRYRDHHAETAGRPVGGGVGGGRGQPRPTRARRPDSLISASSDMSSLSSEDDNDVSRGGRSGENSPYSPTSMTTTISPLSGAKVRRHFFSESNGVAGSPTDDADRAATVAAEMELALRSSGARYSFCEAENADNRRRNSLIRLERKLSVKRTDSGRSIGSDGCPRRRHDASCCKT